MKKIYSSIVTIGAALLCAACANELKKDVEIQVRETSDAPVIYAYQEAPSKSSISVDGEGVGTIYWSPADDISVFYGASTPVLYSSTNTAPETTAAFTSTAVIGSTELASTNIWGLYPHDPSATCNGTSITTTLPATQYGVPGTFDDDLFITVAHSDNTNLHFYNVCGGIKFSLSRDDITSITFRGNNNEDIAGDISLTFEEGLPKATVTAGLKEVILTPKTGSTFANGENYYLILLPGTLNDGFTMKFSTASGNTGIFTYTSSSISIFRSVFSRKANIDSYALFSVPCNQIWYTSTNGDVVNPYRSNAFGANILSNEYVNGKGIITFDNDVTAIEGAFLGCTSLSEITIPDSVLSIGLNTFAGCTSLRSATLSNNITKIGQNAFYNCSALQSITLPSRLTTLGQSAFESCSSLNDVYIKSSFDVGYKAFASCPLDIRFYVDNLSIWLGLTNVSNLTHISGYNLFVNNTELTNLQIPDGVVLKAGCFSHCNSLIRVNIPGTIESVPDSAFNTCRNLTRVDFWQGVKSIGYSAFSSCYNLSFVWFPSVTTIDAYAFFYCSIEELTIQEKVSSIGNYAFANNFSMSRINIHPRTPPSLGNNVFENTNNCTMYVFFRYDLYSVSASWSPYFNRMIDASNLGGDDEPD